MRENDTVPAELKARYEAIHATIMDGPHAELQALIDSGHAWHYEGAVGRAALGAMAAGMCGRT